MSTLNTRRTFNLRRMAAEVEAVTAEEVSEIFQGLGFTKFHVSTSRRVTHRVYLTVWEGAQAKSAYQKLTFVKGKADIVVIAGYVPSGLESEYGGVCGWKVSLRAFYKLIEIGAVKEGN